MESHEAAVLRRSLAMVRGTDPELIRALATLEELFNERARVRALLLRVPAGCGCMRRFVADLKAIVGD